MLDTISDPSVARIGAVVDPIMARHRLKEPVGADAELARLGLTSIDMVEVMLGIEAEFDLSIPPAEITLDNFRSVAAMARLVARLQAAA